MTYTTHRGHSLSKVIWYTHQQATEERTAKSITYNSTNKTTGVGGVGAAPPPDKNLHKFSNGGVSLSTGGESDVAAISWHKGLNEPCGVLSITLKPRSPWGSQIKLNDVLFVYLKGNENGREHLVSILSVDSVGKTRTVDGAGATLLSVQVQCRDIGGKVMMETPTIYDASASYIYSTEFFNGMNKAFEGQAYFGGPSLLVQNMLATFYATEQGFSLKAKGKAQSANLAPFRFPGFDTSLFSLIDTNTFIQRPMVGALTKAANLLTSAANLWSLCDMYSNRLVNEMFIDVRDVSYRGEQSILRAEGYSRAILGREGDYSSEDNRLIRANAAAMSGMSLESLRSSEDPLSLNKADQRTAYRVTKPTNTVMAMVHRQQPFDTVSFYMLPVSNVHESEVYDLNVSVNTTEVFNTFRVRMAGGSGSGLLMDELVQDQYYGLTVNRESIKQHGIRRFDGETIFGYVSAKSSKEQEGLIGKSFDSVFHYYMGLATTWYGYNELLYSGSMTTYLRPDIRVGTRMALTLTEHGHEEVWDYYVLAVDHTFTPEPGTSRTTLQLARGVNRNSGGPEVDLRWTDKGRISAADPFESIVPTRTNFAPTPGSDTGAAR